MKLEQDISTNEIHEMIEKLEQVTSIAKATKYGLQSYYVEPLNHEDLENVFSGIESILNPIKDKLYDVHGNR